MSSITSIVFQMLVNFEFPAQMTTSPLALFQNDLVISRFNDFQSLELPSLNAKLNYFLQFFQLYLFLAALIFTLISKFFSPVPLKSCSQSAVFYLGTQNHCSMLSSSSGSSSDSSCWAQVVWSWRLPFQFAWVSSESAKM